MTQPDPAEIPVQPPPQEEPEGSAPLTAAELAFAALVLAALTRWLRKARTAVLGDTEKFGSAPDSDEILFVAGDWTREVDQVLMPELERVAERGFRSVRSNMPIRDGDTFIAESLAKARNLLVRIPDEVYRLVNDELLIAISLGEGVNDQARRIDRILTVTGSQNWPFRSRLIAVTEVNRAYAAGSLAAGFQAQAVEGRVLFKRWNSVEDRRTRIWHVEADRQTQRLADPFQVGPDTLMYPGDPVGIPSNVIGCRCNLDIVDEEES